MTPPNDNLTSFCHEAWAEINLAALKHNVKVIQSWLKPPSQLMAVVKTDAYGHGISGVASVLAAAKVNWFGMITVDEGCQLRQLGIKKPALVLSPAPACTIIPALESQLHLTVTSSSQIQDIARAASQINQVAYVHVKVDTGTHRLGVSINKLPEVLDALKNSSWVKLVGLFSHLAKAREEEFTCYQNKIFKKAIQDTINAGCKPQVFHLACGEAARHFPDTHYDLARVGLYLYGLEPTCVSDVVSPVLSLRAKITNCKDIDAGEAVGYNLTWKAERPSRLASISIGYADGVDRRLSNCISAILKDKLIKQVGLIGMNQMLFDITDVPAAREGDIITLIGGQEVPSQSGFKPHCLHLATWATLLDTITYDVACRLRVRLPRVYRQ